VIGEAVRMSAVRAEGQLLETDSMASGSPPALKKVPVDKTFRRYDPDQSLLMPPSLRDWLPEGHLAHFVSELVGEVLDPSPFLASHTEVRGYPPYDPRLMLKILLYGYPSGVRSSRKIEIRCHDDVAFRFLAANAAPGFRSVARFRRRHLAALEALFTEALTLCRAAGMVKMGRVALDGTKVRANASRHKAMSDDRMADTEARLAAAVDDMLRDAERVDAEEDETHGANNRGDDLRGELARRESRLAKIRKTKADLEHEARDKAAATAREKATKAGRAEEEAAQEAGRAAESATPPGRNGTSPTRTVRS
jgi:transposase